MNYRAILGGQPSTFRYDIQYLPSPDPEPHLAPHILRRAFRPVVQALPLNRARI